MSHGGKIGNECVDHAAALGGRVMIHDDMDLDVVEVVLNFLRATRVLNLGMHFPACLKLQVSVFLIFPLHVYFSCRAVFTSFSSSHNLAGQCFPPDLREDSWKIIRVFLERDAPFVGGEVAAVVWT